MVMDIAEFFEYKNGELNDKSNKGEDSNKQKESSHDESFARISNDDVFGKSLKGERLL